MTDKSWLLFGMVLVSIAAGRNNELTPAEADAGYKLLWNGKDLSGWRLFNYSLSEYPAADTATNWQAVNLVGAENGGSKSADPDSNVLEIMNSGNSIFTADSSFQNFDWKVEWQMPERNSKSEMIYFFNPHSNDVQGEGMEYPLMNSLWTSEWTDSLRTAGSLYDLFPPLPSRRNSNHSAAWTHANGEWNQSRVITFGKRAAHFGNGLRLLEYDRTSKAFYAATQVSLGYAIRARNSVSIRPGCLMLQDHGQKWIKFRNVKVKRLTQDPWGAGSPFLDKEAAARGDTSLVDTLAFDETFSKWSDAAHPYAIAAKIAARVSTNREGLAVEFSQAGNYSLVLEDLRGARMVTRQVRNAAHIYIPGRFSDCPRILSLWDGDRKILRTVVGTR